MVRLRKKQVSGIHTVRMPGGVERGSYNNMQKPLETLGTLQQIRSKLDEARMLSQSLGTPEVPYDLEVTLDTIIMGIDAQLGALESTGEPDSA